MGKFSYRFSLMLLFTVCGLLVLQAYTAIPQWHTLPVEAAPSSVSDASYLLGTQEPGMFTGKWDLLSGPGEAKFTLELQQTGNRVTGTFSPENGTVDGTVTGNRLNFQWTQAGGYKGNGYLYMNSDNRSFSGVFTIVEGPTKGENSVTATRAQTPQARTNAPSGLSTSSAEVARARDTRFRYYPSTEIFYTISSKLHRLDWCLNWGANCGKPAADAWCHDMGYGAASDFRILQKVGYTVTFAERRECNHPDCAGFDFIECVGTASIFETPRIMPVGSEPYQPTRLDWCREWAVNCGKPAADAYCNSKGFAKGSLRFEMEEHVPVTVTITERRLCKHEKDCTGFKVIECQP